jgi:hypothetical protein
MIAARANVPPLYDAQTGFWSGLGDAMLATPYLRLTVSSTTGPRRGP